MAQPNKGTHGKPNVAPNIMGAPGSKPSGDVRFGAPGGKGTTGKGNK